LRASLIEVGKARLRSASEIHFRLPKNSRGKNLPVTQVGKAKRKDFQVATLRRVEALSKLGRNRRPVMKFLILYSAWDKEVGEHGSGKIGEGS